MKREELKWYIHRGVMWSQSGVYKTILPVIKGKVESRNSGQDAFTMTYTRDDEGAKGGQMCGYIRCGYKRDKSPRWLQGLGLEQVSGKWRYQLQK